MKSNGLASLCGYASALPTPFKGEAIDEDAFASFCEWQISEGISMLVVNGTTGEAPTLTLEEQRRLIRLAVEAADGRVPVIAGAGSNATAHAIEIARQAADAGADGLLVVTPYYNKPSQEGLFRHFVAVHDATDLPIILYDVPSRTGCTLASTRSASGRVAAGRGAQGRDQRSHPAGNSAACARRLVPASERR